MTAFTLNESTGQYDLARPVSGDEIVNQAKEILESSIRRTDGTVFTDPESVKTFLHLALSTEKREVFACLFLDNRHRLIKFEKLFAGTIDGCSVHPRIIVQQALRHNASAVILAHQHPSGIPEPSRADEAITRRVKEALMLIDCRTLDHMVVGSDEIVSMAEKGVDMSCYKYILSENERLREILTEAQNEVDTLVEYLTYGPEFVTKEEVILRLGWLDLPPLD